MTASTRGRNRRTVEDAPDVLTIVPEETFEVEEPFAAGPNGDGELLHSPTEGIETDDPFAALEEAQIPVVFTRGPTATDYEAITPPRIKLDMQKSFELYEPLKDNEGNVLEGKSGAGKFLNQKFPTVELAIMYTSMAKKYCEYRGWTYRSSFMEENSDGILMTTKNRTPSKTLRFCAKPKEVRGPRTK